MADNIGLGLALNVLLWFGALVVVCCVGVIAIMGFIPGTHSGNAKHARAHRGRHSPTSTGIPPG